MSDCVYEARVHGPPYMGEVSGTWCTTHRCWADECDSLKVCENCCWFEKPPINLYPQAAFGVCGNPKNVTIGPSGWNSGTTRPMTTDRLCCSNFELKAKDASNT